MWPTSQAVTAGGVFWMLRHLRNEIVKKLLRIILKRTKGEKGKREKKKENTKKRVEENIPPPK